MGHFAQRHGRNGWASKALAAWVVSATVGLAAVAGAAALVLVAAEPGRTAAGPSLLVVESVVQGREGSPEDRVCVLNSRFLHGQQVVWRIKVIDPATGQPMDDKQLRRVWVELVDGQVFEARFGPHPRNKPTDYFWAAAWVIPPDYPSGTVDYTIHAQAKDGRSGTQVRFDVESSQLIVLPGSVRR